MAQLRAEMKILLEVTEREFSLICHALTGSPRMPAYLEQAKDLGKSLMTQRASVWREKLQAAEHALSRISDAGERHEQSVEQVP